MINLAGLSKALENGFRTNLKSETIRGLNIQCGVSGGEAGFLVMSPRVATIDGYGSTRYVVRYKGAD